MGYDFYCLSCGRTLNQNAKASNMVLFDMQYLLSGNSRQEERLRILKFLLTQAELEKLINSAPADEDGYHHCTLSFRQLFGFIGNDNNMGIDFSDLTAEDLRRFSNYRSGLLNPQQTQPENNEVTFSFGSSESVGGGILGEPQEIEITPERIEDEPYEVPKAIQAIINKAQSASSDSAVEEALNKELESILARISKSNTEQKDDIFSCFIMPEFHDDSHTLLTGYRFRLHKEAPMRLIGNARVCGKCGAAIVDHAGAVEHRVVTFIGHSASAKTSTILSVASYINSGRACGDDNCGLIWSKAEKLVTGRQYIGVSQAQTLTRDLKLFEKGIAPSKTEATKRNDAYSASFYIQCSNSDYRLVSLIDLPGELFEKDGSINEERIENDFPVAKCCDAYAVCFDSTSANSRASNVCSWVDKLQALRISQKIKEQQREQGFAPMIILFTKCEELKGASDKNDTKTRVPKPMERGYHLIGELLEIEKNDKFTAVLQNLFLKGKDGFGKLNHAYCALLRCSPYGFAASELKDIYEQLTAEDLRALDIDTVETKQHPEPKNIDVFLKWILHVTGCLPIHYQFDYYTKKGKSQAVIGDHIISRPQYRLNDKGKNAPNNKKEAAARCALFANPGKVDEELLGKYNEPESRITGLLHKFKTMVG